MVKILKQIHKVLSDEIEQNYKSKAEASRKVGLRRSTFHKFMKNMEKEKGITFLTVEKICNSLGYEIIIKKKD